jgi:DNA polymerase-1
MAASPSREFLDRAVFLVDASSYIFRAYYAIQQPLSAPDGTPTHATYGFLQMLQSLLDMHRVKRCALVWDRKEKGFRHEIFPEYKANRAAPPEDLSLQLENARAGAELLGFPQLDAPGFEADDVLAALVKKHPDDPFVIVTADKDLLQLVGPQVWCLDTLKRKWSNREESVEKFGVPPERVVDVQALCGDSVDNIPGVRGVGPKTAAALIQRYGDLESVLAEAEKRWAEVSAGAKLKPEKEDPLKGKCLEQVATHAADARLSLQLVRLDANAPVPQSLSIFDVRAPRDADFRTWAKKLGFGKTVEKLLVVAEASAGGAAPAPKPSGEDGAASEEEAPEAPGAEVEAPRNLKFRTEAVTDAARLEELLKQAVRAPLVALDTETFRLDSRQPNSLVGFSFCFDGVTGYYVPLRHRGQHAGDMNAPLEASLRALQVFLNARDTSLPVVFQNGKFDLHAFASDGVEWPSGLRLDDTMVASFVLDPGASHGMDALSAKHLDHAPIAYETVTAGVEDFSEVPLADASVYAGEDAVVTWQLWGKLSKALYDAELRPIYEKLDRPLITLLCEMERTGVVLDPQPLKELSRELHAELARKREAALRMLADSGVNVSPDFNFASPKQIGAALFEGLKLRVIKKTKTGPSTDASVLEELALEHPFPKTLLEIREISKLLSTYVDVLPALIDPRTGRVHTDFSQTVAVTGRLSSSDPNLQNIPIRTATGRKLRFAFRAGAGRMLVGADYSQVELRVLAHVSRDEKLLEAFREGADVHRRTAALVLGKAEKDVNDDDRRAAKTVNFGIIYGQTAFGLSKTLGIPRGEAQKFIDAYFATYPGVKRYMEEAVKEARESGAVTTLVGRRRPIPDIHSKNPAVRQFGERTAINSPIQGTAADLVKAAMIRAKKLVAEKFPDARLILQVHDELLFEAPAAQAKDVEKLVVQTMEDPGLLADLGLKGFRVPMKVDGGVGETWGDL